jgi:hypothetical protein
MGKHSNIEDLKEKQIPFIYELIKQQSSGTLISSLEEALRHVFSITIKRRTLIRRLELMK